MSVSIFRKGSIRKQGISRSHAIPEGMMKGDWTVENCKGRAHVNLHEKRFAVPSGSTPKDIAIRNHEYSHIKFSPLDTGYFRDEIDENSMDAFEDIRCNNLAIKSGVDIKHVFTVDDTESGIYEVPEDSMERLLYVMVAKDYEAYIKWFEKSNISPLEERLIDKTYEQIILNMNNYEAVKKLAIEFTDLFREKPKKKEKKPEEDEEKPKEKPKPKFKVVDDLPVKKSKDDAPKFTGIRTAETLSGKMTIIENLEMTSKSVLRVERRTDCGYVLRHPERILTDKMCFTVKKKVNTIGTILVDCSGSMSINLDQLKRIVQKSNGATIAGYSGSGHHGTLYVLSRNGRIVKELPHFPGMNVIDYHALLWLSENRRPSIWVSDGAVTGIEDSYEPEINNESFKVVEKNGIINILNLDKLEELMDGK